MQAGQMPWLNSASVRCSMKHSTACQYPASSRVFLQNVLLCRAMASAHDRKPVTQLAELTSIWPRTKRRE